jgi:arylsulfatase A-like enzyme
MTLPPIQALRSAQVSDFADTLDRRLPWGSFDRLFARLFTALLTLCALASTVLAADRLPNIVYIMADDLGYAELGCYGQEKIETPHIDRLAKEGIRFTQHYTSAPVCAPARCSLMTGKHGGHAIVRNNFAQHPPAYPFGDRFGGQYPLPTGTVTIGSMLKNAGYATGAFGKWGLGQIGTTGDPLKQGFDRFFGYNCQGHAHNLYPRYLVDNDKQRWLRGNTRGLTGKHFGPQAIADEMLQFVRQNKTRPFFLYYPTVIPHLALQVPEEDLAHYKGRWPETPYAGRAYLPNPTPRATYAAMITFMDRQVGRLMAELKQLGIDDNTIVFFTSDNGTTHLGDEVDFKFFKSVGPLKGLKGSVDEGGIREPLIVRWPGHIQPDTVSDLVSAHYDTMATLADIAQTKPPANTDGMSYLPTLLGHEDQQKEHDYLFWDFAGYGGQLAVRLGHWKGVKRNLRKNPDAPLELYDLQADIGEQHNVVDQHPEIAEKINQIMLDARSKPPVKQFRAGRYRDGSAGMRNRSRVQEQQTANER